MPNSRISDVTAFGVGNDKLVGIVFFDILHSFLKSDPAFYAPTFVESEIGFVGYAKVGCCIDDGFVSC